MVSITENKLTIEIETYFPCETLRELQESLLTVLISKERHIQSAQEDVEEINLLGLLIQLLPSAEDYEKAFGPDAHNKKTN